MSSRYGHQSAQRAALVRQLLGEIAGRLETRRPDALLTPVGRIAMIQATTMSPPLAQALRDKAPEITGPVTRREYAQKLRQAAADTGQSSAQADRVAALHDLCAEDYAKGCAQRDLNAHRDDAHLVAGVSESARSGTENGR